MTPSSPNQAKQRRVFVRRRTRTTVAQARGLAKLDEFLLKQPDLEAALERAVPLFVEIGFGNGQALVDFAATHPHWFCVGVEVFEPGMGALVNQCLKREITNLHIVNGEGLTFLESLPDGCLDLLWVLFPDPWPKKRHHKRRLITEEFVEVLRNKLTKQGEVRIATDWAPYAEEIEWIFEMNPYLDGGRISQSDERKTTKYEKRGETLGHTVAEYIYHRSAQFI